MQSGKSATKKKDDSSHTESGQKRLLADSIHVMGRKWNYCPQGKALIRDSLSHHISHEYYKDLEFLLSILIALGFLLASPIVAGYIIILAKQGFQWKATIRAVLSEEPCLVDSLTSYVWRESMTGPAANCHSMCKGLDRVPVVENMTSEEFMAKYAYSGRPVLIRGSMDGWKALDTFSFAFLKRLFQPHAERTKDMTVAEAKRMSKDEAWALEQCQFFPYATDFTSLADFFNMSEARSRLESSERSWYVGWNNCFLQVVNELRDHYKRLDFLPADSESSIQDEIFMGGSTAVGGGGAPLHIDSVDRPSWQGVVAGAKTWTLIPPPECESVCAPELVAEMKKGDVLTFNGNLWYHKTKAEQGVLTIAIGAEYD